MAVSHRNSCISREQQGEVSFFLFLNYSLVVHFALHAFVNTNDENGASNK